eukprot:3434055-Pyramimonas_sp.AAC.1
MIGLLEFAHGVYRVLVHVVLLLVFVEVHFSTAGPPRALTTEGKGAPRRKRSLGPPLLLPFLLSPLVPFPSSDARAR